MNFMLQFSSKCGQGGGGQSNPKMLWKSLVEGPLCELRLLALIRENFIVPGMGSAANTTSNSQVSEKVSSLGVSEASPDKAFPWD